MYSKDEFAKIIGFARRKYIKAYFAKLEKMPEIEIRREISRCFCHGEAEEYVAVFELLKHDHDLNVRINVAKQNYTSFEILSHLANDTDVQVRECVARNIKTPSEILLKLSHDSEELIRCLTATHNNAGPDVLENLAKGEIDELLAIRLAKNMKTPFKILRRLAALNLERVNNRLARNLKTPPDILFDLAKSKSQRTLIYLLRRCWLPEEILEAEASNSDPVIRKQVAKNKSLTKRVAEKLSDDKDKYVRSGLVSSGILSRNTLERLEKDESVQVRASIARTASSPDILQRLSEDPSAHVRKALAYNVHISGDILRKLLLDPDNSVRYNAVCNVHIIPEDQWADCLELDVPDYNNQLVEKLGHYKKIRGKLAPLETLYELLDGKVSYHTIKSEYPKINPDWFDLIYANGEAEQIILRGLCRNPSTPQETLNLYFKTYPENESNNFRCLLTYSSSYDAYPVTAKALEAMALHCHQDYTITTIAFNRHCNSKTLELLAEKGNVSARAAVASHTATSLKTLEKLAQDSNFSVKFNIIRRNHIEDSVRDILQQDPVMAEILEERLKGAYYIPEYNMGYYFNRSEAQKTSTV